MRTLITGANGQVGRALQRTASGQHDLIALERPDLDITDADAVFKTIQRQAPALIINAAAYTAVDRAESEPEVARAVNADGPDNLARAARATGARLIHISTDFVFDGAQTTPYRPVDAVNPLSVYGASKAEGEARIRKTLSDDALIVRTSWVYARAGRNFVNTMLRLMRTRPALNVVSDQFGTPTRAASLARFLWRAAEYPAVNGTYHYSDAGNTSWYGFAAAVQEQALAAGLLDKAIPIRPIASEDYPQTARRPAYSVLDKSATRRDFGAAPMRWEKALAEMLTGR